MKRCIIKMALISTVLPLAGVAFAQQKGSITRQTPTEVELDGETFPLKGYPKRDRFIPGSTTEVTPSQLHEVIGSRVDAGFEYNRIDLEASGDGARVVAPSTVARYLYGSRDVAGGLGVSYMRGQGDLDQSSYDEKFTSLKLLPQVAVTMGKYATIGAGAEINWIKVVEEDGTDRSADFDFNTTRAVASISYHTPWMEIGGSWTSGAADRSNATRSPSGGGLSLAESNIQDGRRDVYIPHEGTIFARGNVSDAWSIQSSTTLSSYDGNHAGAIAKYDDYEISDRIAAKLGSTYWTTYRSRINLTAEYRGGATAEAGLDTNGLGYRAVNLYGGSISGTYSFKRHAYLGLLTGYLRGEEDKTVGGVRYSNKEENLRVVGSLVAKI